ncbi:hypothetical protein V1511DRAFT_529693 [Dipodascopsis uninucleata]
MSNKFNPAVPSFHPSGSTGQKVISTNNQSSSGFSSPTAPQAIPTSADSGARNTSRRNGAQITTIATPRNNQGQRPQHRSSRKNSHNNKPTVNMNDNYPDYEGMMAEQYFLSPSRNRRNQVSISHLLNFTLPPRDTTGRRRYNAPSWSRQGSYVADKAQFVNANFRFVVHPSGDYTTQVLDPDVVIPWHLILQVLVSKNTHGVSCPICLTDDPVASRMARCGHIFCLPCMMRMLESEMPAQSSDDDGKPKKKRNSCPLCFEPISISDGKPVKWMDHPGDASAVPEAGKDVVLRLVMRKAGSILALPRDGGECPSDTNDIPYHYAAEVMHYARIMKGTEKYLIEEYEREIRELEFMEQEDGAVFGEGGEWTHKAIERIFDMTEAARGMGSGLKKPFNIPQRERSRKREKQGVSRTDEEPVSEQHFTDRRGSSTSFTSPSSTRSKSSGGYDSSAGSSDAPYYFYQPRDASYCFLSPLDIKILKTAFGSFAAFPSTVLVRVERINTDQIVDEEFKKRTKYLGHLPTGCPISILECDWTDVVKPELLEQFSKDLERRRKVHRDKELKEERARQNAIKMEEDFRFKVSNSHEVASSYGSPGSSYLDELAGINSSDFHEKTFSIDEEQWPSLSTSPVTKFLNSASTSPDSSQRTTVWGTPTISFSKVGDAIETEAEAPSTWDGWDDERILEKALEESKSTESCSSGRKKKSKKLVLMSTGGGQWRN